jgi:hypothetical protein
VIDSGQLARNFRLLVSLISDRTMTDATFEIDLIRARLLKLATEQAILDRRLAELSSSRTSAGLDTSAAGDSHGRVLPPANKVALFQRWLSMSGDCIAITMTRPM